MPQQEELACRILKLEQQLKAYEKLHAEEFAELWKALNDCKQGITALVAPQESDPAEQAGRFNSHPARMANRPDAAYANRPIQEEEEDLKLTDT
jgi:hypothetical protein